MKVGEMMFLYKDEKHAILLVKDHWKGMVVQVCQFGPKKVVGADGVLSEERQPFVVWAKGMEAMSNPTTLDALDADVFKMGIQAIIREARVQLKKLQSIDEMMDGVMVDYIEPSKKYN